MDASLAALRARPQLTAFVGVFAAVLLGMLSVGAVLPVLPGYVRGPIGAGDLAVGVVVGAFAFSSIFGRPIGGRLADTRGRRRVVVAGLLLSALAGALYLVPAGVPGLIVARLVLGVGEGWTFTAGATWIVDLAPEERRGQAIGIFGLAVWGGLAVGPVLGELLAGAVSYQAVFVLSALSPLAGVAVARRVRDPHVPPAAGTPRPRGPLIPPAVRLPGAALALANVGYGTMAGFLVLHLAGRGVGHGAAAFTAFAVAVVVTRLAASGLPDRLGPQVTALGAFVCETIGLALIALAGSWAVAGGGAVIMGMGFSLLFPSLALIVVDRTGEQGRGAALGTFTAFFDLGVGVGAPLAGAVASLAGYPAAFWVAAGAAAAGALLGASRPAGHRRHGPPEPTPA